jgi:hypothetical protein
MWPLADAHQDNRGWLKGKPPSSPWAPNAANPGVRIECDDLYDRETIASNHPDTP